MKNKTLKSKIEALNKSDYRAEKLKNRAKDFALKVQNSDDVAHIYIYDDIGYWGVRAQDMVDAFGLCENKPVKLHINCFGGEVFEARAICAAIKGYDNTVDAEIDGICASSATWIAMTCENVTMQDGGIFMIHNATGVAFGDHNDMRKTADLVEKITHEIARDYVAKITDLSLNKITDLMADETYMTATEAKDYGFVDDISNEKGGEGGEPENKTNPNIVNENDYEKARRQAEHEFLKLSA
ncbi:MAG: Clp protease ClpP [Alphaproteobacteria bacterium]|nr:Clp protease ClpP [Alphaproteobacteria bacterium]MBL1418883.1 Clp protease ClpP [Alphaproteobacteria bacterium]